MISPILTHVDNELNRLLHQYRELPLIKGLITALLQDVQAIESAIIQLQTGVLLTTPPVGQQLDNLGRMVGVARNGLDDETYLALILGAIAQNTSDGTHAALMDVVQAVYQTTSVFMKDPNSPGQKTSSDRAAIAFGVGSPKTSTDDYSLINRIISNSISAGVGLFYLSRFDASGAFAMKGRQAWVRGFASVANPLGGGKFASLIYSDTTV